MASPLVFAGFCYQHGTETAVADIIVTVENSRTNEAHNGAEALFPELTTNSSGEWQVNLANYDTDYADEDVMIITCINGELKDQIEVTLNGTNPFTNLILTPVIDEIYCCLCSTEYTHIDHVINSKVKLH